MSRLNHAWNYVTGQPHQYEKPVGPGLTVPNDTLSIRQILERYTTGQPIGNVSQREPVWSENPTHDSLDLEELRRADMVDQDAVRDALEQHKKNLQAAAAADAERRRRKASDTPREGADDSEAQEEGERAKRGQRPTKQAKSAPVRGVSTTASDSELESMP